jgi:hypothetical protein
MAQEGPKRENGEDRGDSRQVEGHEQVVFVLRYDEEITFLVNEGVIRPGMLPSGFKEK